MNINNDNYEAYLVDYLDGQLSDDECRQLKQFVALQGHDLDALVSDLPYLEPQAIEYVHKESLKKQAKMLPLFTRVAAAAAAVTLLFALIWNQNDTQPEPLPMAESRPNAVQAIEKAEKTHPVSTTEFAQTAEAIQQKAIAPAPKREAPKPTNASLSEADCERHVSQLLATLTPVPAHEVQYSDDFLVENDLLPRLPFYPIYPDDAVAETLDYPSIEQKSWLAKGILLATNGKYSSISELIHHGTYRASHEVIHHTTKAALTAYYMIDSRIEASKERFGGDPEE